MSARFQVDPGLCRICRYGRVIATRRGSGFLHCERSTTDPAFPRYPRLPVVACRGFAPGPGGESPETPDGAP